MERSEMQSPELKAWRRMPRIRANLKVYTSKKHRAVAMPIGGIGTGSISICGDGSLQEWQIFNQVDPAASIPCSFISAWAKPITSKATFKVLQTNFVNYPTFLPPCLDEMNFVGEYPFAYLDHRDAQLPVQVKCETFSPLIPLNEKDSALPVVIFILSARNRGRDRVDASFLVTLQNAVGYDGFSPISEVRNEDYGGNVNKLVQEGNLAAIHMCSTKIKERSPSYGTMTLASLCADSSYITQWEDLETLWEDFTSDGRLDNIRVSSQSPQGRTWNGALCTSLSLAPKERESVVFIIGWHFPNRYMAGFRFLNGRVVWDESKRYRVGNMYSNWFDDSLSVVEYVAQNFQRLYSETKLFHDTFYDSTLPYYVLDRVSSQLSTIRSPTCIWFEDGTFASFEGCDKNRGCCPMNCTHVWNYAQALAKVFPSLERNMRRTDLKIQMDKSGLIHYRTVLPLSLPRESGPAADGQLGTVLKVYREHVQSVDGRFLEELWPDVKRAMMYVFREMDTSGRGIIVGEQFNTYDRPLYGPNTFIGSLYLAALRATEEMAKIKRDSDFAKECRKRYERGRSWIEANLWNGRYYIQKYDKKIKESQYGTGCLSDQLAGEWWAKILNLGHLLNRNRVRKTLRSIFKYNWRTTFRDFTHSQRVFASDNDKGLTNCSWPTGCRPLRPIRYCDEVWTGVEYQVAAHMIFEMLIEEGLTIVKAVSERYDGVKRNPWNEIECGDHYIRPMSSWSVLLASEGYIYNGLRGLLGFKPRLTPENFKAFFTCAECWGSFAQYRTANEQTEKIKIEHGKLDLRELIFEVPESAQNKVRDVAVCTDIERLNIQWTARELEVKIMFECDLKVREGQTIIVKISWEPL